MEIQLRKHEGERVRKEKVRLEERTRIAQELHDTLLQSFMSASMQLHVTLNDVPLDSAVRSRLDRILQIMKQGMEEGRNAIQGLRSTDSRTLDLFLALSGIQQELAVHPDIDFRVFVVGQQKPLRPTIHHEIYRIGREALVNAFRHSVPSALSSNLNIAKATFTCGFATTDVESIIMYFRQDANDTGAWSACVSERRKSEDSSRSAVRPPGPRSSCPSQAVLHSNSRVSRRFDHVSGVCLRRIASKNALVCAAHLQILEGTARCGLLRE